MRLDSTRLDWIDIGQLMDRFTIAIHRSNKIANFGYSNVIHFAVHFPNSNNNAVAVNVASVSLDGEIERISRWLSWSGLSSYLRWEASDCVLRSPVQIKPARTKAPRPKLNRPQWPLNHIYSCNIIYQRLSHGDSRRFDLNFSATWKHHNSMLWPIKMESQIFLVVFSAAVFLPFNDFLRMSRPMISLVLRQLIGPGKGRRHSLPLRVVNNSPGLLPSSWRGRRWRRPPRQFRQFSTQYENLSWWRLKDDGGGTVEPMR